MHTASIWVGMGESFTEWYFQVLCTMLIAAKHNTRNVLFNIVSRRREQNRASKTKPTDLRIVSKEQYILFWAGVLRDLTQSNIAENIVTCLFEQDVASTLFFSLEELTSCQFKYWNFLPSIYLCHSYILPIGLFDFLYHCLLLSHFKCRGILSVNFVFVPLHLSPFLC